MLHEIFQRHGLPPHHVYNAPDGARRFMYASMAVVLEEEKKARKQTDSQRNRKGRG